MLQGFFVIDPPAAAFPQLNPDQIRAADVDVVMLLHGELVPGRMSHLFVEGEQILFADLSVGRQLGQRTGQFVFSVVVGDFFVQIRLGVTVLDEGGLELLLVLLLLLLLGQHARLDGHQRRRRE